MEIYKFWTFVRMSADYTEAFWKSWKSIFIKSDTLNSVYKERSLRYEGFLIGMAFAFDIDAPEHQELFTRIVRDSFPDMFDEIRNNADRLNKG